MGILIQPFSDKSIGDIIQEAFRGGHGTFDSFQAAVAFAKRSGVQHIEDDLKAFIEKGNTARIVVGVDLGGTSSEGLEALIDALGESGELFVSHDENTFTTFHPKIYFFEGPKKSILIVGSGNLTQGGLYSNDEGFAILELDTFDPDDRAVIDQYKENFEKWCNEEFDTVRRVNRDFIESLKDAGYVSSETMAPLESDDAAEGKVSNVDYLDKEYENESVGEETNGKARLFGSMKGRRRPPGKKVGMVALGGRPKVAPALLFGGIPKSNTGFVMTLMQTDVGTGQTTPGASRRSPEIFIPLTARNADPEFWGWDSEFTEDATRPGKYDRMGVKMRLGGKVVNVNMMTWPVKHDFRLRSEALRSAGAIGDLIKIEKIEGPTTFDYYVEIIPQGALDYDVYLNVCVHRTPNSEKRWGYY